MLQVKKRGIWLLESAGGSKIWTSKLTNRPSGSSEFWLKAIRFRLILDYDSDSTFTAGGFHVLQLKPYPGDHYTYTVAVMAKENNLYLSQIYYPDSGQFDRFNEKILSTLERIKL